MEKTKIWAPNILNFELVMCKDHYYVLGVYIPPSDLTILVYAKNAWHWCPRECRPLLINDLNINLEFPPNERDKEIAEQMDAMDLVCMTQQFRQCCLK